MLKIISFLINLSLLISSQALCASQQNYSLELQQASLPDALHLAAKFLQQNIIISPSVTGTTTVHLQHLPAEQLFTTLLAMNGLAKWEQDKVWLIAPATELAQYKEAEMKWQATLNDTAALHEKIWQINYAQAEDIAQLLHDDKNSLLSKRGYLKVDKRTNRIYAHDTAMHLQRLARVIQALDVPVKQIMIAARLASVDHDAEKALGIDFSQQANGNNKSAHYADNKTTADGRYSIAIATLADGSLLDVKLTALEKKGQAELISNPSLFTADQQAASIEAGEEVPYQEKTKEGATAVTFKKAVLALKVTPHVLPGNQMLLELQINQDRPNNRLVLGVPTISTRQITTRILVKNGQTIVLGGIYESNKESGEQGLPWLQHIPILGWLFKQSESRHSKRELLIFVTPKIMN